MGRADLDRPCPAPRRRCPEPIDEGTRLERSPRRRAATACRAAARLRPALLVSAASRIRPALLVPSASRLRPVAILRALPFFLPREPLCPPRRLRGQSAVLLERLGLEQLEWMERLGERLGPRKRGLALLVAQPAGGLRRAVGDVCLLPES